MAKLELVRFQDGTYGIRMRSWLAGERFIDLQVPKFRWRINDRYFPFCKGNEETARKVLERLADHGETVKEGE